MAPPPASHPAPNGGPAPAELTSPILTCTPASPPASPPLKANTFTTTTTDRPAIHPLDTTVPPPQNHMALGTPTVTPGMLRKADTDLTLGGPAGLPMRNMNHEYLRIFRTAVGINTHLHAEHAGHRAPVGKRSRLGTIVEVVGSGGSGPDGPDAGTPYHCAPDLEEARRTATGLYAKLNRRIRLRKWQHHSLDIMLYVCYFGQILIGAALTALGPGARDHAIVVTVLGAVNTVIAGALALIKGQGLLERLSGDEVEFGKIRDWVEETEAMLAVGVMPRDCEEIGVLVETAFRKYKAAQRSKEDNKPGKYVSKQAEEANKPGVSKH